MLSARRRDMTDLNTAHCKGKFKDRPITLVIWCDMLVDEGAHTNVQFLPHGHAPQFVFLGGMTMAARIMSTDRPAPQPLLGPSPPCTCLRVTKYS